MKEIRRLELQRSDVIIALDEAHYLFREYAEKAKGLGLHISSEMKVCGDAEFLVKYGDIVEDVERYGEKTLSLSNELTEIDYKLDELYRAKFEELKSKYAKNPLLNEKISIYEQHFKVALVDRTAGNFLERMEIRL